MISSVIVGAPPQAHARPLDTAWQRAAPVLAALGLAIAAVAVIDLALAWMPFQFGNKEWEFGTVTRTFDSLALGTTGLAFLTVAVAVRNSGWGRTVLGLVFVLLLVALVVCLVLYGLNVPVAIKAVPAPAAPVLKRAIARTSAFGLIYIMLYGWLCWFTWRGLRAGSRGGSV